jgi:uncharacterized protein (DUF488 family)
MSRKKGFSKKGLEGFLVSHGIEYVHYQELGVPAELRSWMRGGGNLTEYFAAFRKYLRDCEPSLDALAELASSKRCCLMCLEHDAAECHRSIIVEALLKKSKGAFSVRHL